MNVYDQALKFKSDLDRQDVNTLNAVSHQYNTTLARLNKEFTELAQNVVDNPQATKEQLTKFRVVKQAVEVIQNRMSELHINVTATISASEKKIIDKVTANSEDTLSELNKKLGNNIKIQRVNEQAFEKMIGFTADGTPLRDILAKHSPYSEQENIINVLREGVLRGKNPKQIAKDMMTLGYQDKAHALLVARTETMRVAHEVGMENYKKNGIKYVQWVSGETAETCAVCWSLSGKIFEIDKLPHDHPNGRCSFTPYLPEIEEDDPDAYKHNPEDNFADLDEKQQRQILGPKRFEMWKNGELALTDLATVSSNDTWGDTVALKPADKIKDIDNIPDKPKVKAEKEPEEPITEQENYDIDEAVIEEPVQKPEKLDKDGEKEYNIIKEETAKPKTPAEIYGIDKQFTEQFNSMSSEMQGLFAPYLKEGAVDPDFDDSGLSAEEKANKNYKSPLDMALKMQEIALNGFNYKTLNSGIMKTKSINPYSVLTHDLLFGKLKYPDDINNAQFAELKKLKKYYPTDPVKYPEVFFDSSGKMKPIFKIIKADIGNYVGGNSAVKKATGNVGSLFNEAIKPFTKGQNSPKAQPIKMATDLLYGKGVFFGKNINEKSLDLRAVLLSMLVVEEERRSTYRDFLNAIKNNKGNLPNGIQIKNGQIELERGVKIDGAPREKLTLKEFMQKYPSYNNSFSSFSHKNAFYRNVIIKDNINIEDIISFYSRETWHGQHHEKEQEFIVIGLEDYK